MFYLKKVENTLDALNVVSLSLSNSFYFISCRFSVNQGKLYSIKLERVQDKSLLIVSGDEGVSVFDWDKDIWKAHLQSASPKTSTKTMSLNPLSTFQPHPSPLEAKGIEVNEIELVQQGSKSYLFGAAGDSFGAYKWDLSTKRLVANYATTCGGYLHAIRLLPSDDGSDAKQTLLTGGEGGKLSFWDVSADKLIDKVDLTTVTSASTLSTLSSSKSNSSLHRSNSMNKRSKSAPARWISSICAQDQNWLTVGGGTGGGPGSRGSGNAGGFLATFHGPTRSLISFAETRETPQQLAIFPSSSSDADFEHHTLVSVANEGVVSHFNSLTLERTRRLWCTPPSAYATSVSEDGKYTAVAGVGCLVDVFNASGEKSMRLSIY